MFRWFVESLASGKHPTPLEKKEESIVQLLTAIIAPMMLTVLVQVIISSSFPRTLSKGIGGVHLSSGDTDRTTLLFPPPLSSVMSIFGQKIPRKNFLVAGI